MISLFFAFASASQCECQDEVSLQLEESQPEPFDSPAFIFYVVLSVVCLAVGGIMSGLNVGLFGIHTLALTLRKETSQGEEVQKV